MQIVALAEDSVEQPGRSQKALSVFLTRIVLVIENKGGSLVATPRRQHHFVFTLPVQEVAQAVLWHAERGQATRNEGL